MPASPVIDGQSGLTSAPIKPQAVQDHPATQRPNRRGLRQSVGRDRGGVVAPSPGAIDEQIAAAEAEMAQGDGFEGLRASNRGHAAKSEWRQFS